MTCSPPRRSRWGGADRVCARHCGPCRRRRGACHAAARPAGRPCRAGRRRPQLLRRPRRRAPLAAQSGVDAAAAAVAWRRWRRPSPSTRCAPPSRRPGSRPLRRPAPRIALARRIAASQARLAAQRLAGGRARSGAGQGRRDAGAGGPRRGTSRPSPWRHGPCRRWVEGPSLRGARGFGAELEGVAPPGCPSTGSHRRCEATPMGARKGRKGLLQTIGRDRQDDGETRSCARSAPSGHGVAFLPAPEDAVQDALASWQGGLEGRSLSNSGNAARAVGMRALMPASLSADRSGSLVSRAAHQPCAQIPLALPIDRSSARRAVSYQRHDVSDSCRSREGGPPDVRRARQTGGLRPASEGMKNDTGGRRIRPLVNPFIAGICAGRTAIGRRAVFRGQASADSSSISSLSHRRVRTSAWSGAEPWASLRHGVHGGDIRFHRGAEAARIDHGAEFQQPLPAGPGAAPAPCRHRDRDALP